MSDQRPDTEHVMTVRRRVVDGFDRIEFVVGGEIVYHMPVELTLTLCRSLCEICEPSMNEVIDRQRTEEAIKNIREIRE